MRASWYLWAEDIRFQETEACLDFILETRIEPPRFQIRINLILILIRNNFHAIWFEIGLRIGFLDCALLHANALPFKRIC